MARVSRVDFGVAPKRPLPGFGTFLDHCEKAAAKIFFAASSV
jgi:hypothetical protein